MAHVCYKANSDVCHTAAILYAAHGDVQQQLTTSSLYKLAVHRTIFGQHYVIRILTPQLRWVKAGFYYCSDYLPQNVYGVFWIVVDDVNKQIGFHGNAPPSRKQRPLIKAALTLFQPMRCRIFLITSQSWYCSNALYTQNLELTGN